MAMLTLKGKITNYVEFGHGGGYATINSLMVECEDGRRQTFEKALIGRSDVMQTLEAAMQAGEPVELHIERPLAAHLFGGAQIFGIKTTRIAHFDPRNVALEQARLIPLVLLAAMVVGGIFGLFSGHAFSSASAAPWRCRWSSSSFALRCGSGPCGPNRNHRHPSDAR